MWGAAEIVWACPRCQSELSFRGSAASGVRCPHCGTYAELAVFRALIETASNNVGDTAVVGEEASCFFHPNRVAALTCQRCGRFICHFCRIAWAGEAVCPACVGAMTREENAGKLASSRFHYDSLALAGSVVPLATIFLTLFTAPLSLGLALFTFSRECSIAPRSKYRFVLALLLSLAQIAAWAILFIYEFRQTARTL